jgi:protein-S-isoprenylcysteine O-methyltransferase Ste14
MFHSSLLVGIQFAFIGLLAWYGEIWGGAFANAFVSVGIFIGVTAVVTMRFRFNVLPEVRDDQTLSTSGPYDFVRHPMYTAVLLVTLGFALKQPDGVSAALWLALAIDLRVKLGYEERALAERFPGYAYYMARTKRLIPWVYYKCGCLA